MITCQQLREPNILYTENLEIKIIRSMSSQGAGVISRNGDMTELLLEWPHLSITRRPTCTPALPGGTGNVRLRRDSVSHRDV